jgi:hypothetical protein
MNMIKEQISEWLNIEQGILNEIEIEDIKFEAFAEKDIDIEVGRILALMKLGNKKNSILPREERMLCKSFWIEPTKDLVLYIWIGQLPRAIVVPSEGWSIRDDITYN